MTEPFEVEASDPNFDEAEVMLPEGEQQQQQEHAEIPVPRRKRRKKKKNRQPVDPLQLEEGEVDEESSEYTDVSDSDTRDDGNGKSEGAVPREDGETGVGIDALETCNIIKGTNSAKDIDRTCTKEGDNSPKQLHRNSESEKLELNVQEKTKKTSVRTVRGGLIGHIQTMSHLNDADTLSVDDGSEFEEDQQEEIRESGKHEPQGESNSDQPIKNCENSRISAERERLDEAGESASSDKERDGSDSSSSGVEEDEEKPRESKTDSCNVDSEQTDKIKPKLDVLELELRARAIRSLMKHCAVDKQT
ncbi:hypothetical protein BSL78_09614 [Apostichopus japonicus]|uniref:Uncharacterized protein n=1 Tax=Stichopus japonicus TaxID=307972 RepID=A0A2G8KZN5_STIJA|nr:hypothetical protein BSL78_09614 [Apostichopus japonicus]